MKKIIHAYPLTGLFCVLLVMACHKTITDVQQPTTTQSNPDTIQVVVKKDTTAPPAPTVPFPQAPVMGCSYSPLYGDTIIYPQPTNGQDYIVNTVNSPGAGKYLSWPVGMVIDSTTGTIDVTKSQTGMRYAIGFIKSGTTDTCLSTLVIGGADYMDSVYVLANGGTTASPFYEADAYLPSVCSGGGCSFDVTGSAAGKKVIVNPTTGVIDLEKTLDGTGLLGGAFGLLPLNGTTVNATIYYRLTDPSNSALQHIDVELEYFYSKSQIGSGLLNTLTGKLGNILTGNLISTTSNPRPPLVIIVRKAS